MNLGKKATAVAVALVWGSASLAQAEVLFRVTEPAVTITAADLEADAQSLQPEVRHHALADTIKVDHVGKSLAVRAAIAQQAREQGLDRGEQTRILLQQAQDNVLMDLALQRLMDEAEPSEADLLKYAEAEYKANPDRFKVGEAERKASHILIRGTGPESKERIDALYQELKAGADFGELAFAHSEDPRSAANYGSLGFFGSGKMVPEFEQALDTLTKQGDYTEPFESQFGWHIVRFDDQRDAGVLAFDAVKDDLIAEGRARARIDARDTALNAWLAKVEADEGAIEAFAEHNRKQAAEAREH